MRRRDEAPQCAKDRTSQFLAADKETNVEWLTRELAEAREREARPWRCCRSSLPLRPNLGRAICCCRVCCWGRWNRKLIELCKRNPRPSATSSTPGINTSSHSSSAYTPGRKPGSACCGSSEKSSPNRAHVNAEVFRCLHIGYASRSSADFITTTSGFRFLVHTGS